MPGYRVEVTFDDDTFSRYELGADSEEDARAYVSEREAEIRAANPAGPEFTVASVEPLPTE